MTQISTEIKGAYRALLTRGMCPLHAKPMKRVLAHRLIKGLDDQGRDHRVIMVGCPRMTCGLRGYATGVAKPVALFGEFLFLLGEDPLLLEVSSDEPEWTDRWSMDVTRQFVHRALVYRQELKHVTNSEDPRVLAGRHQVERMASVARRIECDYDRANRDLLTKWQQDAGDFQFDEAGAANAWLLRAFFITMRRLQDTIDSIMDDPELLTTSWLDGLPNNGDSHHLSYCANGLILVACSLLRDDANYITGFRRTFLERAWQLHTGSAEQGLIAALDELSSIGMVTATASHVKLNFS